MHDPELGRREAVYSAGRHFTRLVASLIYRASLQSGIDTVSGAPVSPKAAFAGEMPRTF
jgi:hypothetical protein